MISGGAGERSIESGAGVDFVSILISGRLSDLGSGLSSGLGASLGAGVRSWMS